MTALMQSKGLTGIFYTLSHTFKIPDHAGETQCMYPGCLWVFCHHEHEVDVDQVCAAADADNAAL